ncbi:hypothetical protein [Aurantimonas sp. Leaf443]|uniref:hypothetical protein n=1 Tax=Aurantimonas sp. Leaf443 TaxID=1736378 RepID=UPI0006F654B1|nr:hypothetical protein [Aurantimonas sp. Leaf443]KQT85358.1 hypothetical protein ASG48_08945 [Aurantimonas sp. Leaf443]
MIRSTTLALFLATAALTAPALAQGADEMASAEEKAKVDEALAKVGCKAEEVEKESATLFEVDDAACDIGQYDIKLNGGYKITVMTLDE